MERRKSFPATESDMEEFKNIVASILTPTGAQSKMTISYIKVVSTMLSIVSSTREGNLYRHLEAERKFLPLFFVFDHVHYARYNSFQHIYLKHLQTTNTNAFNDLCIQGYGATSTGDPFSAIHGDLVTEHFNRETKETA